MRVCKTSEITSEDELYRFDVEGKPVLVIRKGQEYYVADSICTHQEADLSLGILYDETVTCPLHQAKFDLRSGNVLLGPDGTEPDTIPKLKVYKNKIEREELFIDI